MIKNKTVPRVTGSERMMMYAELKRMCINCSKTHVEKTSFCKRCLETRKKYCKRHPEKILGIKLKHKYGIDLNEYETMLKKQDSVCMICKNINNRTNYKTNLPERLVVDHNHETKKVRGLLCHRCNMAVGIHEKMNPLIISYLAKFKK